MTRRAAAIAVVLLGACSSDRRGPERAVRAYNEASILAYRTREFGPLRRVATAGEWGRVVVLVDLKSAGRLVLESELESFEVAGVERHDPGRAVVRTKERWRYRDRPLDPGKPRGPEFLVDMALEYQLVKEEGRWKVDRSRARSSDYLEPKGFVLDRRPHSPGDASGRAGPADR